MSTETYSENLIPIAWFDADLVDFPPVVTGGIVWVAVI